MYALFPLIFAVSNKKCIFAPIKNNLSHEVYFLECERAEGLLHEGV